MVFGLSTGTRTQLLVKYLYCISGTESIVHTSILSSTVKLLVYEYRSTVLRTEYRKYLYPVLLVRTRTQYDQIGDILSVLCTNVQFRASCSGLSAAPPPLYYITVLIN